MTVELDGIEYITITDAALELSTTKSRILMLLKHKSLEGTLTDEGWLVTRGSMDCFDRHARSPEHQARCSTGCSSRCGAH